VVDLGGRRTGAVPGDGSPPPFRGPLLPAPGGFHITLFTLPANFNPDDLWGTDDPALREQMFKASIDPQTHPLVPDPNPFGYGTVRGALHTTASMDCLMQISGESVFVLEETEIRLQPGDWLIVNGVPHSCRNDLDEAAALAGIVIGAHHDGVPLRTPVLRLSLVAFVVGNALAVGATGFHMPAAAPGKKVAAAGLDGSGLQVPELGPQGA
jgi:hypothetical protein